MNLCESIKIELNEGVKDFIKKKYKVEDKDFEKISPDHSVKCVAQTKNGWVGFSHRASCEFKIGDKLFEPEWDDNGKIEEKDLEKMKYIERGGVTIKTMEQAKKSASNFAKYVS